MKHTVHVSVCTVASVNPVIDGMSYIFLPEPVTDLALRGGRGHLAHVLLIFGVRGVLCQLIEDVGARRVCDVQVVTEGRAVCGGAGERMLLIGLLCKIKKKNKKYS